MRLQVHGTAVVVGTTGLIVIGPSGAGKSSLALRLMVDARRSGHLAALVGDDQVFVDAVNGRLVATAPDTIRGMIELRGSGIGQIETIACAVLHVAILPITVDSATRIPEENQQWSPGDGVSLPLCHIDRGIHDPFAWLTALIPGFPVAGAFQL